LGFQQHFLMHYSVHLEGVLKIPILAQLNASLCIRNKESCTIWGTDLALTGSDWKGWWYPWALSWTQPRGAFAAAVCRLRREDGR